MKKVGDVMKVKFCPKCNGKVSNETVECIHCGYVYPGYIKCPDCGGYQEYGKETCNICGYSFTNGKPIANASEDIYLEDNENNTKLEDENKTKVKTNYKVGDKFEYGKFAGEPILWRVLDIIHGKLLVISEYIIESKMFDKKTNNYDKSEIKKWLECNFKNAAFTVTEASKVEKIYLLSKEKVEKYFKTDEERKCKGTKHAIDNGLYVYNGYSWWWISSIASRGAVYCVSDDGWISDFPSVNDRGNGVRAACVINL